MYKKSQGLSINVIVIVAIALIVLIVLVAIFTGRLGGFSRQIDETITCQTSCTGIGMFKVNGQVADIASCASPDQYVSGNYKDSLPGVCCCTPP